MIKQIHVITKRFENLRTKHIRGISENGSISNFNIKFNKEISIDDIYQILDSEGLEKDPVSIFDIYSKRWIHIRFHKFTKINGETMEGHIEVEILNPRT